MQSTRWAWTPSACVESFDPDVLARVAPAKARTGIDGYFRAWERAVQLFGRGQVSTYVILGMGEDLDLTVAGCRRAIDLGVYPFVVPLRPVPGTPLGDVLPPGPEYMESVYRRVVPYLVARGLGSWNVRAGCARCQACSAMTAMERSLVDDGRRNLPLVDVVDVVIRAVAGDQGETPDSPCHPAPGFRRGAESLRRR